MEPLPLPYMLCYSMVVIILVLLLSYFLLRDIFKDNIQIYESDEDEEGGISAYYDEPDIPLPPGIGRPINDWEPEYNRRKEYV